MDSLDLLAREDEFKKLNKQLEKKTESLMKEIEHAMQKQDIFSAFSPSLTLSPVHTIKKHSCNSHRPSTPSSLPSNHSTIRPNHKPVQKKKKSPPNSSPESTLSGKIENGTQSCNVGSTSTNQDEVETKSLNICNCCANMKVDRIGEDGEFLYAFVSVNVKDKVLPQSFLKDRPTVENVCKFLSSKVKLMQEQIDRMQDMLDKKATQCEGHLRQLAELESERLSLMSRANNMKASTADMKAKNMVLLAKLNSAELESERLSLMPRTNNMKTSTADMKAKNMVLLAKLNLAELESECLSLMSRINNMKSITADMKARNMVLLTKLNSAELESERLSLMSRTNNMKSITADMKAKNMVLLAKLNSAELESERLSLMSRTNNMKASTADMKAKNMVLVAKLNEKERLYKEQRTETDRLTCELKRCRVKCNSAEAKSAALQETADKLRTQIEAGKRAEKVRAEQTGSRAN
ncbi:hypothetical protein PYW07_011617 [Mythimna separata]|uniref:Uncharacterized protein n=1 Tax=Mythimna separata TaxID=271217 RepID=A0AAD7Y6S5_MYTSE|nr:hypothetical protein PYW07_011617 [Mythimna separata]